MKDLKQNLGKHTEAIEKQIGEYYFSLEPWQRGTSAIGLIILLILTIYWLTKEDNNKLAEREARRETLLEEKLLRRMELLNKLKG